MGARVIVYDTPDGLKRVIGGQRIVVTPRGPRAPGCTSTTVELSDETDRTRSCPGCQKGAVPSSQYCVNVPLRWSDMDAYGHVNNVQFLRLLEDAG